MAKLYANENFPQPAVEALRALGHDVLTTLDSGKAGQAVSDEEVLLFATSAGRILITFNRKHFIRLHHEQRDHAGIIVCSFDLDFGALAQRIDSAISSAADLSGMLLRVNRPN